MDLSIERVRKSCIQCGSAGLSPIFWIGIKGIPHGHEGHYIAHSHEVILKCQSCKQLQIEIFDHDCWSADEEPNMYWWYSLDAESSQLLEGMLESCPDALSQECNCLTHQSIRTSSKKCFSLVKPSYNSSDKTHFCWLSLKENDGLPVFEVDKSKEPSETP